MRAGSWCVLTLGFATFTACGGRTLQSGAPADGGGGPATSAGGSDASAAAAGADGSAAAAEGGSAGAAPDPRTHVDVVWPGAGCGRPLPDDQPMTVPGTPRGYKQYTVMGTGANLTETNDPAKIGPRTFWVRVPSDYDPNHAYRVVYIGQGCGPTESADNDTFQLYREGAGVGGNEEVIYVALDIPADGANVDCYDNVSGPESQEWEAFQLFEQVVDANYCTDLNRIYVAGYSTGGALANQWGCYFAGWPTPPRKFAPNYHIRGQAVAAGFEPDNQPPCSGPVAAIWLHDSLAAGNPIAGDETALARVGRVDGCDASYDKAEVQAPWNPDPIQFPALGNICKTFTSCPSSDPVVFCTTTGIGQTDNHNQAIPAFNLFFDQVEAQRAPGAGP
jgi:hypothetical protein